MPRTCFCFGRPAVLAAVAICTAVCIGWAPPASASGLVPISGLSPYPDGGDPSDPLAVTACNGGPQGTGVVYRNSETEPYIAVNPTNPDNMITAWHQDRWSTGSAQGVLGAYTLDGGLTWTPYNIPFTQCAGGTAESNGDYERASDPWLSFGPDGAAYYMALVSDRSTSRNGMVAAKSVDGGVTWTDPITIKSAKALGVNARSHFHDKNTLTADPYDPNLVYATWTLFRNNSWALLFSRSTDGGMTWGPARPVNKNDKVGKHSRAYFRQFTQIVVLPDGTLVNVFFRLLLDPRGGGSFAGIEQALFRSRDQGEHWERLDTPVADIFPTNAIDAELLFDFGIFLPVRDAGQGPDIAVDRTSGDMYMVWQDGRFNAFGASSTVISKSSDGGDTWTDPMPVHDLSNAFNQYFLPAVAVADDGTVGVLYYDFRNDVFGDAELWTDVHVVRLDSDLNVLDETRLTEESFDMRQMLLTGDRGYFPGDYVGLETAGNDFVAAFTVANNLGLPLDFPQDNSILQVDTNNRQDIVFARVPAAPSLAARAARGPELAQPQRDVGERSAQVEPVLHNAKPNPFNPTTTIAFELPGATPVRLQIYDVTGRLVRALSRGESYPEGRHELRWDGRNSRGQSVASGVYLYRLETNGFVATKRMVLMK